MLENLEKNAIYKILSLTGLLIGIVFGAVKLKQELMPASPATEASSPSPATPPPPVALQPAPAPAAPVQHVQNQLYIDLDNFELGKQYVGKTVDLPILFDGFTPWLAGPASPATASLAKRYLFLSHFDINQPQPPKGMLSSQTIVVPLDKAQALRALKTPSRILLSGQVKLFDVKKELGMSQKFNPDSLIFEVESFQPL